MGENEDGTETGRRPPEDNDGEEAGALAVGCASSRWARFKSIAASSTTADNIAESPSASLFQPGAAPAGAEEVGRERGMIEGDDEEAVADTVRVGDEGEFGTEAGVVEGMGARTSVKVLASTRGGGSLSK